jgi:hypothetical protein
MNVTLLDDIFKSVYFDRELVYKFFVIFSIFENALKNTEFKRKRRDSDAVEADWTAFANKIHEKYDPNASPELANAINYLLTKPPKLQVVDRNQELAFRRSVPTNNDTVKLSVYICRVRNNLFHGAKYRYRPRRDTLLIKHSLMVLEAWSQCNSDVKKALALIY